MKARRAARGSLKEPKQIPYTKSSPFVASAQARGAGNLLWKKPMAFLSRMVSVVMEKVRSSPSKHLKYGDILRDIPFHVHNRIISYFSTHPTLCVEVFGVSHGQCIRFTHGPWARQTAIVIGVRGGKLWVLDKDGPVMARPLFTIEQHDWEKLLPDEELLKRLKEGLEVARRGAELDYDPEQREFLQKAPDLFVEVVDDDMDYANAGSSAALSSRGSCAKTIRSERYTSNVNPVRGMDDGIFELPERSRKRVILVPQIAQVTGDAGWAGEGLVVVNGGGVRSFTSSLSASVLL
ncbi:uncharacterized protein TEOVI_000530700 [Trypanosoma equiperdum]|uniref:Uncharacterized protein n=2 Tax=Trypanozoon TaxID=39700 RepID=Q386D3_TRYB2|nr:hypothetical protein, conserved [Trypanosoma brucei brucei TREU927]EAN79348.1 hypothetical protein, conserved [Trypanosoma brucei brucei TREU927]SCU68158.1 hypothetical protein, conserved [Trypanosoma equiperdum]